MISREGWGKSQGWGVVVCGLESFLLIDGLGGVVQPKGWGGWDGSPRGVWGGLSEWWG